VALWRDFPERLAIATRLPVVAYDRLGFGQSDTHTGSLPLTFIRDEAITVVRLCEAIGIKMMVPFGHSVGGAMAIATRAFN
jgi:pimeloyl-ACP methyl ester carboxylesterase